MTWENWRWTERTSRIDHLRYDWGVGLHAQVGGREVARIHLGFGTREGTQSQSKTGSLHWSRRQQHYARYFSLLSFTLSSSITETLRQYKSRLVG